jgi:hypothetical protein
VKSAKTSRAAGLLTCLACAAYAADPATLKTSRDPKLLLETALECARSARSEDHQALLNALGSAEFLGRLDNKQEYLAPPRQLRLARVMDALAQNNAAHRVLTALTGQRAFTSFEPRQELLIRSLAAVRPAPEAAIRFWNLHAAPDAPYLTVTIDALADNGSEPALTLLATKLADSRLDREDRIAWMRDAVLRHRNEPAMLKMCRRLLDDNLAAQLKPSLVEALFDYREAWYLSDQPPPQPDVRRASPEAVAELRGIGELALKQVRLTAAQRAAVERTLASTGPSR